MANPNEIPCPECDKMIAVHEKSQVIGEFLEWLRGERGLILAHYDEFHFDGEFLMPVNIGIQELLAEYFEIDLNKVEEERRALLAAMSGAQRGVCLVTEARKGNG